MKAESVTLGLYRSSIMLSKNIVWLNESRNGNFSKFPKTCVSSKCSDIMNSDFRINDEKKKKSDLN